MGDITTGYAFSSGETNVDHTKLNNVANLAVINSTFLTGKSAVADNADPATYLMLFCDPSASGTFYKGTLNKLFTHTSLINGSAAITTLAGTEAFHVYDGANKKITAANLYTAAAASAALIASQTQNTDPVLGDSLPIYDLSTTSNKRLTLGSLINDAAAVTTVTSTDVLSIGNGTTGGAGSYSKITAYNLMGGNAALTGATVAANDELSIRDVSASTPKRITVDNLLQAPALNTVTSLSASNAFIGLVAADGSATSLAITYANVKAQLITDILGAINSADEATGTGTGYAADTKYTITTGLTSFPRFYKLFLVALDTDGSYAAGQEIPSEALMSNTSTGAATVNYYLDASDSYKCKVVVRSEGTSFPLKAITRDAATTFSLQLAATRKWAWRIKWIV